LYAQSKGQFFARNSRPAGGLCSFQLQPTEHCLLALVGESARLGEDVPWARRVCRVLKDTVLRAGDNLETEKKKRARRNDVVLFYVEYDMKGFNLMGYQ